MPAPQTLYDKIWQEHLIKDAGNGASLVYIDRHLIHEVTSPQAFEGLEQKDIPVHRPDAAIAVPDHNVPTKSRSRAIKDPLSRAQIEALRRNCERHGIRLFDMDDPRQGIVHVMGPEQGLTLPGMTIVCGDSHTSTHGAFGALAFGIGTSEVEHVLATQTLTLTKSKNLRVCVSGRLGFGVTAKDMALAIIHHLGTAGATGHVIEFAGEAVRALSMEGRMTLCNMAIEAGGRAGLIAPDDVTFTYLQGKPYAPKAGLWEQAQMHWTRLHSDEGAHFDRDVTIRAEDIEPQISWGTSPEQVLPVGAVIPSPDDVENENARQAVSDALRYMGLQPGTALQDIGLDYIFIGSCTNARIEDLRAAAAIVEGRRISSRLQAALIVPGSGLVKEQAESEGLDKVFLDAGFEWREPGCSMCLAMNADKVPPGARCASTSNRNFVGRQGPGSRTHLVSPAMAAAAAVYGHFVDVRDIMNNQEAQHEAV